MVFAVNPSAERSFEAFRESAVSGGNATAAATSVTAATVTEGPGGGVETPTFGVRQSTDFVRPVFGVVDTTPESSVDEPTTVETPLASSTDEPSVTDTPLTGSVDQPTISETPLTSSTYQPSVTGTPLTSSMYQPSVSQDGATPTPGPMVNFNTYSLVDLKSELTLVIAPTPRAGV